MSDIKKIAIYDDRIVQNQMSYGIQKGGVSVTAGVFQAIAATSSQITFQLTSPSENVFIDRAIDWTATVALTLSVDVGGTPTTGLPVLRFGLDCALCQFPLNSLVSTMTATINDTTVSTNNSDTLYEVLRLTDSAANRAVRTCPYMADNYASYNDGYLTNNTPLNAYGSGFGNDYVPNGSYNNVFFTNSTGAILTGTGTYTTNGVTVDYTDGVPVITTGVTTYPIHIIFTSTEKICLSPFIYADSENDTGLFSIQNISFVMNLQSPSLTANSGRIIRSTTGNDRDITAISFNNTTTSASPITNARINCVFCTPSLSLPLPSKSLVPWFEFPRYNTRFTNAIASKDTALLASQTITLSAIPDFLIIYCKPRVYADSTDADYYYPIQKISINFDNYSGLMSAHTTPMIYSASSKNGLQVDYQQFTGEAKTTGLITNVGGYNVALTGSPIVIKPGTDFALSQSLAPGILGNFTFQCDVTVYNQTGTPATDYNLWVIAANSGFFESKNGMSRIIRGASLTAEEVINASTSDSMSRSHLTRVVGGKGIGSMFSNVTSKIPQMISMGQQALPVFKALAPIVKPMLPEYAQKGLSAIGMGSTGGARTGGRSLSSRLM